MPKIEALSINEKTKYYIYGIYDNETVIYIGITKNPYKRKIDHINTRNKKLAKFIFDNSYNIDMRIICIFYDEKLALEYEAILINRFKNELLNIKNESHRL